ncbi:MAG: Crp/Fnr family transcriptional regulator [Rhodocyclaceae bacterium]|nr:Crp/Fnr family transcriptional regulator [Rhodocyclaceae bacterium]
MIPINNMHNFSDALPPGVQEEIDAISNFRNVPQGGMIFRAGGACTELVQIRAGEAKVSSCNREGREAVAALIRPGDWIGVSEIFSGLPTMSDVLALSPVKLRAIGKRDFEALIDRHPVLARHLLRLLSLRFSAIYYMDVDRSVLTLKERVLKTLYMLSFSHGKTAGDEDGILIALSQAELGKLLAASRQNLNRVLKGLEQERLLTVRYGGVRLHGLEAIRQRYGYLVNVDQPAPVYGE